MDYLEQKYILLLSSQLNLFKKSLIVYTTLDALTVVTPKNIKQRQEDISFLKETLISINAIIVVYQHQLLN